MENYKVLNENFGQGKNQYWPSKDIGFLIGQLFIGSYGKVALVRHLETNEEMVWKQTNYGGMNDKEKQQLINEVNILRELKHENIVRCFDKFVDKKNTSIYLVMEYCKGGDLGKLIQQCRTPSDNKQNLISEDFIWRIFTQVVLALYECHRRKNKEIILHRDLKPSNIFLDEYQNAKLGDFGFARALKSSADGTSVYAKTYLGSPYYMSPEQCNGQEYNEKSDIWSLGIILYELAQLSPPFMATNQLSLALKIREGTFKRIPTKYSEELMRVIKWMLQVDPTERPNVEDLLNLPHVSMRLRERALKRNLQHMKRKEEEVIKKELKLNEKRNEVEVKERELKEREIQLSNLENQLAEMERQLQEYEQQDEGDASQAIGISFNPPTSTDTGQDSSEASFNENNDLVVRRVQSNNGQLVTSRSKLDNTNTTINSFKSSDVTSGNNNKVGMSLRTSYPVSPRSTDKLNPSTTHDYTEIMGYKNINISRDVDQSYMLKGGSTNRNQNNKSDVQSLTLEKQSSTGSCNPLQDTTLFLTHDTSAQNISASGTRQKKQLSKALAPSTSGGYYTGTAKFKTGRTNSIQQLGTTSGSIQSQISAQIYLNKTKIRTGSQHEIIKSQSTSSLGSNGKPRNIKVVKNLHRSVVEGSVSPSPMNLKVTSSTITNGLNQFLRQSYESKNSLDSNDVNPCLDSQSFQNPLQQNSVSSAALPPKVTGITRTLKAPNQSLQQLESLIRKSKLLYSQEQKQQKDL